jgi:hypothetical protein
MSRCVKVQQADTRPMWTSRATSTFGIVMARMIDGDARTAFVALGQLAVGVLPDPAMGRVPSLTVTELPVVLGVDAADEDQTWRAVPSLSRMPLRPVVEALFDARHAINSLAGLKSGSALPVTAARCRPPSLVSGTD